MSTAPMTELKFGAAVMRYERVKMAMLTVVLIVNLALGTLLLNVASDTKTSSDANKRSLVILSCAVSREVQAAGDPNSPEQRAAFDACVDAGGPRT